MAFGIQNFSSIAKTSATSAARTHGFTQSGQLSRTRVRKLPNPTQAMEDLQEELSSARSEDLESKKIEESRDEESEEKIYQRLIAQVEKKYPAQDEPQKKHLKDFLAGIAERNPQSQRDIQELLSSLTQDEAEAFALLHAASGEPTFDPATRALLSATARSQASDNKPGILAGINTIEVSKKHAKLLNADSAKLQASYQNLVASYAGILPALTQLAQNNQLEKFDAMTNFIMQAAATDLASPHTSTQPRRLLHVLSSFQGVKIFNTIHDWSNKTFKRIETKNGTDKNLTQQKWLATTLQYVAKPERFNTLINLPLNFLTPTDRVLTLQNLRRGVAHLPNYLWADGEADKARVIFPLQNEIDKLVFEQDA